MLRDFFERGGTPDDQMFDTVMDLCMRTGEFRRAMQVRLCLTCINLCLVNLHLFHLA